MKLILPFPPSVNTYWRHPNKGAFAGKSLISAAGRKFQSAACAAIVEQLRRLPKPTSAPASVEIVLFPPDNQLRDQFTERLESMATDNCARWVLSVVRRDLGFDDSHVVTMPELCWWLIRNDLADALPESAARKALRFSRIAAEKFQEQQLEQPHHQLVASYDSLNRKYSELLDEFKSLRRYFSVSVSVPYTDVWMHKPVQFYPGTVARMISAWLARETLMRQLNRTAS